MAFFLSTVLRYSTDTSLSGVGSRGATVPATTIATDSAATASGNEAEQEFVERVLVPMRALALACCPNLRIIDTQNVKYLSLIESDDFIRPDISFVRNVKAVDAMPEYPVSPLSGN